jgi:hypothetical protein
MKSWTDLAFVIEDEKDIGDRLGLEKARVAENRFEELDQPTTALFELFQLLIANNDYSVMKGSPGDYCCHNAVMYTRTQTTRRHPGICRFGWYERGFTGGFVSRLRSWRRPVRTCCQRKKRSFHYTPSTRS